MLSAAALCHSYTACPRSPIHIVRLVTLSFGNIMLIARQKPDANNVAGLRTWNSLGRFVKRGEKGIFILAPMVGRRSTKDVATDEPKGWSVGAFSLNRIPTPMLFALRFCSEIA